VDYRLKASGIVQNPLLPHSVKDPTRSPGRTAQFSYIGLSLYQLNHSGTEEFRATWVEFTGERTGTKGEMFTQLFFLSKRNKRIATG